MVVCCSAYKCPERHCKEGNVSFFCFPRDPELQTKWLRSMKRKHFLPSKYSRICSKHFVEDDFEQLASKRMLKKDAIPTIFNVDSNSEPSRMSKVCKRKKICLKLSKTLKKVKEEIKLEPQETMEHYIGKNTSLASSINMRLKSVLSSLSEPESEPFIRSLESPQVTRKQETNVHLGSSTEGSEDDQYHENLSLDIDHTELLEGFTVKERFDYGNRQTGRFYIDNFNVDDLENPAKAKTMWSKAVLTITRKNEIIKDLKEKNYRLCLKNERLNALIEYLRKTNKISREGFLLLKEQLRRF